ncbi:MAG: transketolase [Candidatus Promineofilum sp.]|nr:transketolase [Promineifilum sp.]MCW5865238.1 transketolase [Anaerolineae bacterium]
MSDYPLEKHYLTANVIRGLAMDAVQRAESGHPGLPMGMADAALVLWRQYLRFNPADPMWFNRDRFLLSAGHGSMLLYSLLHLSGYDLPLEELKNFRQWGSLTPGHPELHLTPGVETSTGPLGQGIANAVGMAIAEQWLAARFNRPDFALIDHMTYALVSDGDLMEGISHEACSLAGHLGLGKLVALYDDNHITIDGKTDLAFSEDVLKRFEAYGWHTLRAEGQNPVSVNEALAAAMAETERPSIIACRTTIGFGSPNRAGTSKAHGEPLGRDEVRLTKERLGLPVDVDFYVPDAAREFLGAAAAAGATRMAEWEGLRRRYEAQYPAEAEALQQMLDGHYDVSLDVAELFTAGKAVATRVASGVVLNAIAPQVPTLLGGSGDLTPSNKTDLKGAADLKRGDFSGRYIRFGVREHGMGGILNGLALHGGVRPYGGTFLVFSDYMRPSIRLAALMEAEVIYVFTHDSIGVGEDGPTHQPVEQVMALRVIPNLVVIRPADPVETVAAWLAALANRKGPVALILTRQNVPWLNTTVADAMRGGYVLAEAAGGDGQPVEPQVILIGTGSEVQLAVGARELLAAEGIAARVVSLPSWELFAQQPEEYRESVLPGHIRARVSVEAGVTEGWQRFVGLDGRSVGVDRFGASAPYQVIYEKLGVTAEAVAKTARELVRGQ